MSPLGADRDARIAARGAMVATVERSHSAWTTANATVTTQIAAAVTVMAGVAVNTISAQNITDINAALTAAEAARVTAATNANAMRTAVQTSESATSESPFLP